MLYHHVVKQRIGRGEKINGGRPARHPAGALRAFKFAPGKFVEPPAPACPSRLFVRVDFMTIFAGDWLASGHD